MCDIWIALSYEILIKNRKNKSYKIIPVLEDNTLMSKEAYYAKLDRSIQEAKEGKTYVKLPNESLSEFLRRTE